MRIVVQKFGGTSVATQKGRLAAVHHIEAAIAQDYRVVVVVSAMGRQGDPYATDTLLSILDDHAHVSKRDLDILMSCGEAISAVKFSSLLRKMGNEVVVLSGQQAGIVTDDAYGGAGVLDVKPARILQALQQGKIVVVMGFQGATCDGDTTTLGRGGSDTTAALLGVALEADYVDIFSDVDGIMTADPRIVPDARCLSFVSYSDLCYLAHNGAQIVHPFAVEIAMKKSIPLRVRNTLSNHTGTLVKNPAVVGAKASRQGGRVTGITCLPNLLQFQLERGHSERLEILSLLKKYVLYVDPVSARRDRMTFTIVNGSRELVMHILREQEWVPTSVVPCARIAVVGASIEKVPNIATRIANTLSKRSIQVLLSGDSEDVIWCLVEHSQKERAVRVLHEEFQLTSLELSSDISPIPMKSVVEQV